jgi:hypothetical protein
MVSAQHACDSVHKLSERRSLGAKLARQLTRGTAAVKMSIEGRKEIPSAVSSLGPILRDLARYLTDLAALALSFAPKPACASCFAPEGGSAVAGSVSAEATTATAVDVAGAGAAAGIATSSRRAVCWGLESRNASQPAFGQLGNDLPTNETRATPVPVFHDTLFERLASELQGFCAIGVDDSLPNRGRGSNGTNGPSGGFVTPAPALIAPSASD